MSIKNNQYQNVYRKFVEVKDVNGQYEVETPNGFKPIKRVMKTIPYEKWYLELEDDYKLDGADNHIVFYENGNEVFLKDVSIGDYIQTNEGLKKCIKCYTNHEFEHMYDIEVEGNVYYSNGILSHNTTAVSIYVIWYNTFNPHKTTAILANKDDTAKSILDDIKIAYENLPDWLKIGVTEYNAHTIAFENGSKVFCRGTSKDACAGESISVLYLDEFALIPNHIAEEFYSANYPTISRGEKIVITSTARGVGNLFHELWKGAMQKMNTYVPYRVDYWQVPEYSSEEWKENMISDIGQIAFNSEYGNQFIGSQSTVINAEFLKKLKSEDPTQENKILNGSEKIWEEYNPKFSYLAVADIGLGSGNDFSTLQIFKIVWHRPNVEDYKKAEKKNEDPKEAIIDGLEQVFVFRSNLCGIPKFVDYTFEILPQWGNPFFIVENNGIGQSFVDKMTEEYYYENAYIHDDSPVFGVNSSSQTKTEMVNALKEFGDDNKLIIKDSNTINELLTFIEKTTTAGHRRFQAEEGSHDDLVMGVGWACFLAKSIWLEDMLTFQI